MGVVLSAAVDMAIPMVLKMTTGRPNVPGAQPYARSSLNKQ